MGNGAHNVDGETRSQTIERHTRRQFHELRVSWQTFAEVVVQRYHDLVPERCRDIDFDLGGDLFVRAKRNAKRLQRFLEQDATTRMPVDIEEAWVLSLAEPYRGDCKRELARRYGLLDVPLPDLRRLDSVRSLADVTCEFGAVLSGLSPALSDFRVTREDLPHVDAAIPHLQSLIASAEGLLAQLEQHKKTAHSWRAA